MTADRRMRPSGAPAFAGLDSTPNVGFGPQRAYSDASGPTAQDQSGGAPSEDRSQPERTHTAPGTKGDAVAGDAIAHQAETSGGRRPEHGGGSVSTPAVSGPVTPLLRKLYDEVGRDGMIFALFVADYLDLMEKRI
jgi:hypothetical protein